MPMRPMAPTLSGVIVYLLLGACSAPETTQPRPTVTVGQDGIPAGESAHQRMQRIIDGMR
ncbi:MAG: hypothetical protein BroJett029_33930 [Alphaproteobacteria bacterium]|nr:MAG: hypothetical protein BroJett029_33930 [Alphaproteobacteria bacterium]